MISKLCLLAGVLNHIVRLRTSYSCDSNQFIEAAEGSLPRIAGGALSEARLIDLPAGVILRSGQIKITQRDLDAEIAKAPKDAAPLLKRNLFFRAGE